MQTESPPYRVDTFLVGFDMDIYPCRTVVETLNQLNHASNFRRGGEWSVVVYQRCPDSSYKPISREQLELLARPPSKLDREHLMRLRVEEAQLLELLALVAPYYLD